MTVNRLDFRKLKHINILHAHTKKIPLSPLRHVIDHSVFNSSPYVITLTTKLMDEVKYK